MLKKIIGKAVLYRASLIRYLRYYISSKVSNGLETEEIHQFRGLDFCVANGWAVKRLKNSYFLENGVSIRLRDKGSDFSVFNQIFVEKEYEFCKRFFGKEEALIVVDAGANIGLTSLYLSQYFSFAQFFCIEPSIANLRHLAVNLESNDIAFKVWEGALWAGGAVLSPKSYGDGRDWSFSVEEVDLENPSGETVSGISVQEFIDHHQIDVIDFFKMDIEGAEKVVFAGDLSWLKKVRLIAVEVHADIDGCYDTVITALKKIGFKLDISGELILGQNVSI